MASVQVGPAPRCLCTSHLRGLGSPAPAGRAAARREGGGAGAGTPVPLLVWVRELAPDARSRAASRPPLLHPTCLICSPAQATIAALVAAGKKYVISTGGAAGKFTCSSAAGFALFMTRCTRARVGPAAAGASRAGALLPTAACAGAGGGVCGGTGRAPRLLAGSSFRHGRPPPRARAPRVHNAGISLSAAAHL